jgi:hypothetical protein
VVDRLDRGHIGSIEVRLGSRVRVNTLCARVNAGREQVGNARRAWVNNVHAVGDALVGWTDWLIGWFR